MKTIITLAAVLTLTGCTTPMYTLQNPKTGQIQVCGGNTTASISGGMIGYHYQKEDDKKCVNTLKKQGFKVKEEDDGDTD